MGKPFDVVIVGSGGAGLAAAVESAAAGARTLVLERAPIIGGSTAMSGGVFYAAATSVQRELGIVDSWEAMERYYLTLNQYRVDPALVRVLCRESGPALEWLLELGVGFPAQGLYESGVDGVPRGHTAARGGGEIADVLRRAAEGRGATIWLSSLVTALREEHGEIVGVLARGGRGEESEVAARSVVLTTGGFGQDPEMVRRHYPSAAQWGSRTWAISCPGSDGSGIKLGQRAGAAIAGHDRGLLLLTPAFEQKLEVDPPHWLIYVNRDGRRFVRESAPYAVMSGLAEAQPGSIVFAVFDEASLRQSEPSSEVAAGIESGIVTYQWRYDHIQAQVAKGKAFASESLAELARRAGIDPIGLERTVAEYNSCVTHGADLGFFKEQEALRPIHEPPYYAVQMMPATICLTSAGLAIDPHARVLDPGGRPIPGLYAAGETTGGVLGERYVGGGNSIANAVVFGRIAGRAAAARALGEPRS